ncbi:MAG: proton-conducting transporter membrane subunit [Elusimicrobiota bacterium]|nr:proton-conducting transporter membrane subunit [Elusimicrobiota bacterium]
MNILLYPIFLPIVVGAIIILIKRAAKSLSVITTLIVLILSFAIFVKGEISYSIPWLSFGIDFSLRAYSFSAMCVLFSSLFAFLICLYSAGTSPATTSFILINLGAVNGALLSNNFVILIFFWEIAAVMLYLLIRTGGENSYKTATKALYIVGFSDFCLLLGIILLWNITGSFQIFAYHLPLTSYHLLAFSVMTIGALAKAGAMPFHTWIPDASKDAPVEVMAYLPASIDKLLGIYLLARICTDFFSLNLNLILMFIGAFTIIAAVFMALVQHDLKKLLSYHAVSQVGYMVLGIGTGTTVGILGGIFHMLNNTIYKTCLFLCSGAVEKKTGTTDLDKLGGLSKLMPLTFFATLIAALSISGVPPFNGFFSKWMIYQGLIQQMADGRWQMAVIFFLVAAMFGSALTLASFIKVIHSVFLGQRAGEPAPTRRGEFIHLSEVSWTMWLPTVILAFLCVLFGVFAYQIPLKYFIFPSIRFAHPPINWGATFIGLWQPDIATLLIIAGLVIGAVIYLLGTIKAVRRAETYIYGEDPEIFQQNVRGTEFYLTISDAKPFSIIYKKAEQRFFDFYNWAIGLTKASADCIFVCIDRVIENMYIGFDRLVKLVSKFISELQGGLLQIYLYWSLFGLVILLFILCG